MILQIILQIIQDLTLAVPGPCPWMSGTSRMGGYAPSVGDFLKTLRCVKSFTVHHSSMNSSIITVLSRMRTSMHREIRLSGQGHIARKGHSQNWNLGGTSELTLLNVMTKTAFQSIWMIWVPERLPSLRRYPPRDSRVWAIRRPVPTALPTGPVPGLARPDPPTNRCPQRGANIDQGTKDSFRPSGTLLFTKQWLQEEETQSLCLQQRTQRGKG